MRVFKLPKALLATGWLLLFFTSATLAQENKWSVGVKGGSTFSFISNTNEQILRTNFRPTLLRQYTGGLSIQYLTESNFGLQVEVNYTQKGWEERPQDAVGDRSSTRFYRATLDYAEVPILAHGYVGKRNTRLFANAGVYLAYLLSSNTERANVADDNIDYFYEERFQNMFDFGVRGGGGLEVVTRVGMFQAEGSYSWGINSILDKNINQIPNIMQNNTIAITLGYYVQF